MSLLNGTWDKGTSAVSAALVAIVAATAVVTTAAPASADPAPANITISKSGPAPEDLPLAPGDTFNYVIEVTCSTANCYDATMTDPLPPPLVLNGTPTVVGNDPFVITPSDSNGDGVDDTVSVEFNKDFNDLANPGSGMTAGNTTTITIPVKVPDDANYDFSGETLVNEATFDSTNSSTGPATDDWPIEIDVPLNLDTSVEKSFDPTSASASAGESTTATITANNQSETGGDSFSITDPAPGSASNTFDFLDLDGITIVSVPEGADDVTITVNTTGGDVTQTIPVGDLDPLPYDVDLTGISPDAVTGINVEFTDDGTAPLISADAEAVIELDLVQQDPGELTDDQVVVNFAGSEVSRDDDTDTATSNEADYTIETNIPTVEGSKSFSPDTVVHGDSSVATITAGVGGELPVESLTVTEPSSGSFSPDGMQFEGFAGPVTYPTGADSAEITFQTTSGPVTVPVANGETPVLPPPNPEDVTSFSITFTNEDDDPIVPDGDDASFSINVGTAEVDGTEKIDYPNDVTVTGTTEDGVNGLIDVGDILHAFDERIDAVADKSITPNLVPGFAGEWVVLQLTGGIADQPVDGSTDPPYSTIGADEIVIQDPEVPGSSDFWDAFNPSSIADVSVPAGTTLNVNYYNTSTGAWEPLPGMPVVGEQTYSASFPPPDPANIGGLQFVYTPTNPGDTFDPGTTFKPNVVMNLDDAWLDSVDWGDDGLASVTNCASADAEGTAGTEPITPDEPATACEDVTITEPDSDGTGPEINKTFVNNNGDEQESLPARSHRQTTGRILWSTGGTSNVDVMTIVDEPFVPATDQNTPFDSDGSFYDVFDLMSVSVTDPLLPYDAVDAVQIYNGDTGTWVKPTNSQCDGVIDNTPEPACEGAMPEFSLTAVERTTTVAVRLVYIENPDESARATVPGEIVPPVGSGVARSDQTDGRTVDLRFRLRDWLRSDSSVAVDEAELYNTEFAGLARNTAEAQQESELNGDVEMDWSADIAITAADLAVSATKTWDGSPVGIPPEGTLPDLYPHTGVELTVTNSSTIAYVDSLSINDRPTVGRPAGDTELLMSDVFNIEDITSITLPAGADGFTLNLYCEGDDATPCATATTQAQVDAWTASDLEPVVGLNIEFHGRDEDGTGAGNPTTAGIEPGATGSIEFLLVLREEDRYRGNTLNDPDDEIVYAGMTVNNVATGTVDDAAAEPVTTDDITDDVLLEEFEIAVAVQKGFTDSAPASPDEWVTPYTQVEETPETQDEFIMWLAVTPTAGARPLAMSVSDLDPSFWNTYEFVRVHESFERTTPIALTQMHVCLNSEQPLSGEMNGAINGGCDRVVGTSDNPDAAAYNGLAADSYAGTGVPALPAGYAAEDVIGLVFTFSSETAWDNPWNPLQTVPVVVKRRTELLTGDAAPPTDLVGNDVAPGESTAGHTVNDIEGTIVALLGEDGTVGNGLHNSDASDSAEVIYEHSITAATVTKSPGGPDDPAQLLSPGASVPFELTFTNTGTTPIYNPVFTDLIPDADGDGTPDLRIDPNVVLAGNSPYSFAYTPGTGDVPDGWVAPPTTGDAVTVTSTPATGDPDEIAFSFPDADVALPVGASYTITIQMVPQPGISPAVTFTNTAVIDGDRPFDYCETDDSDPAAYVDDCRGTATNAVAEGGAIRTGKAVRAGGVDSPDYTYGAFVNGAPEVSCEPEDSGPLAGFYVSPCIPRTIEGQTETWALAMQNTGNVPLTEVVAVDRIPAVGDQTVLPPQQPRNSEWNPILTNPVAAFTPHPGGGVTLETYVSTAPVPCTDRMTGGDCGDEWVLWDDYTGDVLDVTGLMLIGTFDEDNPLAPGEVIVVEAESLTPATVPANENSTAFNSVATSAVTNTGTQVAPTEGVPVGVALATGSIDIDKDTDGDGAGEYALDEYIVTLVCTVDIDGETVEVIREDYTLEADGAALTVDTLPTGALCTLEESDYGQVGFTVNPGSVVVPFDGVEEPESVTMTITNTYRLASVEVTKHVLAETGDPTVAGPFEIGVLCLYRGAYITATNEDNWEPYIDGSPVMVVELGDEESVVLADLPAGAECYAGEYPGHGASRVGVLWETADDSGQVIEEANGELIYTTDPFTLTPDIVDDGRTPTNFVDVYNQYASGALAITKDVSGPGAGDHVGDDFVVDVLCVATDPDNPDVTTVTFDDSVTVPANETVTLEGILVGSECTLTEPDAAATGADQWVFDPSAADDTSTGEITIVDDDTEVPTAEITVDNRFEVDTELVVEKIVEGPEINEAGELPELGPFSFEVQCVYAEGTPYEREIFAAEFPDLAPGSPMTFDLVHGETETLTGMPTGTVCTVTETDQAGAESTTVVTHTGGTPPSEATEATEADVTLGETGLFAQNEVIFTNTYPVAPLTIVKELTGEGAPERGDGPFVMTVLCESDAYTDEAIVTYEGEVTLGGDAPLEATIDSILSPSTCEVTEIEDGGADGVFYSPGDEDARSATVDVDANGQAEAAVVTVTNHFEPFASLEVAKTVDPTVTDADGNAVDLGPYIVMVQCTYDEGGPNEHRVYADGYGPLRPMVVTLDDGESAVFNDIPAASVCTVTEVLDGGAASTTITVTTAAEGPTVTDGTTADVTLTPDAPGTTNEALVTNTFAVGAVEVSKVVDGPAADVVGAGPFTVHLECTWTRDGRDPVVTYSDDLTFGGDAPMTATASGIAVGSTCVVTETDPAGASSTQISVDGADAVTGTEVEFDVVEGDAASATVVTVTNTFGAGALQIDKELVGEGAPEAADAGPFTFAVECTLVRDGQDGLTTFAGDVVLGGEAGLTVTLEPIATGSTCTVTETGTGGADDHRITPSGDDPQQAVVTIEEDATVVVTAYNHYEATEVLPTTGYDRGWMPISAVILVGLGLAFVVGRRRGA
ncbi:DUF5979 domain-containing protein [Demequina globuliformis]|uniref:DUF5979 domain-containing protein n=1 Tax=Demequina globuliformis TaxID=676202 RepID=UPI0007857EC1|nr:DUF5979 domain-containing protein [Demequina globuliformis]